MRPLSAANTRGPLVGVGARITAPYYGWVLVGALGITETISWGVLYYAFSVFVEPMEADLGWSLAQRLAYRESGDDQLVLKRIAK